MPTRTISLTAEQDASVEQIVKTGEHRDALKLKSLRARIKAGSDAIERGAFIEIDDADLDGYVERLTPRAGNDTRRTGGTDPQDKD